MASTKQLDAMPRERVGKGPPGPFVVTTVFPR